MRIEGRIVRVRSTEQSVGIKVRDKSEYQKLMKFINELDPKAFITVYNVSSMKYQPKSGAF